MHKYIFIILLSCCCLSTDAQTTRFVNIGKSINTPQQDWTLNSVYAKPFYTILAWTVQCKDMTASVYIPDNTYIEDLDTHIRYGLAKKPTVVNPSTFNQSIKYELTFKGIPSTVRALKFVAANFIMNNIILDAKSKKTNIAQVSKNEVVLITPIAEESPINKDDGLSVSDIDINIPQISKENNSTFVVIIANENYTDVEKVPYAIHDGEIFQKYCTLTLGIPQSNIKYVPDATLNNIKRQLTWLSQVMEAYNGNANIIFYYAGHGIPDESDKSAYLLPVDGFGSDVSTGYSLDKLYAELGNKPAKSVVVLLDACFSGTKRDGGMLASARGVAIKAKQNEPKGKMIVLSAAQGDETAYPYKEKGHGMFTYYLLKKLQETKGEVTYGELADYVTIEVKKQSIVTNGKIQTPNATAAGSASDWKFWKLR